MSYGELEYTQQGKMPSLAPGKEEPLAGIQAEDRGAWGNSSVVKALGVLADSSTLATKLANGILDCITRRIARRWRQVFIPPDYSVLIASHLGTADSFRPLIQESWSKFSRGRHHGHLLC